MLPKTVFLKFLIDQEYGGNKLSVNELSNVLTKTSSVDPALGVLVMVPNSLGPAELIIKYGTQEQKDKYLPTGKWHKNSMFWTQLDRLMVQMQLEVT